MRQGLSSALVAVGVGVFSGYYIFRPMILEQVRHDQLGMDKALSPEQRAFLRKSFEAQGVENHGGIWDNLWKQNIKPWDRGVASPALVELLEKPNVRLFPDIKKRRALVPGGGKGYDAILFSELRTKYGIEEVFNVDISPKAVEEAKKSAPPSDENRAQVNMVVGNFFKDNTGWATEPFDLIYDYTFLCAIPPEARSDWASRMASLTKPGGVLITLEFPLDKPVETGGPPHGLSPELYESLLSKDFVREYHERPSKYFEIGKNDYIDIWRRKDTT